MKFVLGADGATALQHFLVAHVLENGLAQRQNRIPPSAQNFVQRKADQVERGAVGQQASAGFVGGIDQVVTAVEHGLEQLAIVLACGLGAPVQQHHDVSVVCMESLRQLDHMHVDQAGVSLAVEQAGTFHTLWRDALGIRQGSQESRTLGAKNPMRQTEILSSRCTGGTQPFLGHVIGLMNQAMSVDHKRRDRQEVKEHLVSAAGQ